MADNQLDILIRIITQELGPQKTADILKKTTEEVKKSTAATQESSKATEQATIKTAEWKKILSLLGHEFGVVGQIARFAFNPIIAGVAGAALVIAAFKKSLEESKKTAEALAAGVPQDMQAVEDAVRKVKEETDNAKASTKQWEDALSESTKNAIADLKTEKEAILEIIKARAALAISAGADEEETRKRLDRIKTEFDLQEKNLTIVQRKNELAGMADLASRRESDAKAGLGGLSVAQAKESVAFLTSSGTGIQQQISNLEKLLGEAPESQKPEIRQKISSLRQLRDRDIVRVGQLSGGIAASEEAQGLRTRIRQGEAEVGRMSGSLTASSRAAQTSNLLSDFFSGGGRLMGAGGSTSANMLTQLNAAVAAAAESKMAIEQLITFLTNIFKDGIVTKQEIDALFKAVANSRRN